MRVITFPEDITLKEDEVAVYLGGSIEDKDWQKEVINTLEDINAYDIKNLVIYNPRGKDGSINDKIAWNNTALLNCDIFSMYFCDTDYDMINFYRLGRFIKSKNQNVISAEANFEYADTLKVLLGLEDSNIHVVLDTTPEVHAKRIFIDYSIKEATRKLNGKILENGEIK